MWNNEITRQLGIKLPFVGAGMAIVGAPELTAAVSNAGGVGLFCLGPGKPEVLADRIDSIRRLTAAPFGVDFIVEETGFGPATTEAHVEVAIAKRVPLAVFFWNPPEERWMSKLKRAGIKVWGTAYSVESARRLKALGADAVIAQSHEAGGHVKAVTATGPRSGAATSHVSAVCNHLTNSCVPKLSCTHCPLSRLSARTEQKSR